MEEILEQILSHPLLSFTLALLCVLLLFAILKGLIKLVMTALILVVLYFGYVSFLQDDYPLPKIDDDLVDQWNEWIEPYRSIDLNVTLFEDDQVPELNMTDTPRE
ncbi:MAG: hypothetical protein HN625_01120 [Flavobacteriaceae bacterium]|jgi:hypothetical protein|nr:hypothetical protein [Opitutae bacterium]MBT7675373.1 hypothetical protein [Flavobacteriaceae bacterium]